MLKLFLDMDDVLVDLNGAILERFGKNFHEYTNEMFGEIDADFWANLSWCSLGNEILDSCVRKFGESNICLLTAPSNHHGCFDGKMEWIKRNIPTFIDRVLVGKPKYFCAGLNGVLIDDLDKNIIDFESWGGRGILYPQPWNTKSEILNKTDYLHEQLRQL